MDPDMQCPDFLPLGYARKSKRLYSGGVEDGPPPEFNPDCFQIVKGAGNQLVDAGSSGPDAYQSLASSINFLWSLACKTSTWGKPLHMAEMDPKPSRAQDLQKKKNEAQVNCWGPRMKKQKAHRYGSRWAYLEGYLADEVNNDAGSTWAVWRRRDYNGEIQTETSRTKWARTKYTRAGWRRVRGLERGWGEKQVPKNMRYAVSTVKTIFSRFQCSNHSVRIFKFCWTVFVKKEVLFFWYPRTHDLVCVLVRRKGFLIRIAL